MSQGSILRYLLYGVSHRPGVPVFSETSLYSRAGEFFSDTFHRQIFPSAHLLSLILSQPVRPGFDPLDAAGAEVRAFNYWFDVTAALASRLLLLLGRRTCVWENIKRLITQRRSKIIVV